MTAPGRPPLRTLAWAAAVAASAAAGWMARGPGSAPLPAASGAAAPAPAPEGAVALPRIIVADDGRATLHVEQQPVDWVIEQLAAQAGRRTAPALAPAAGMHAADAASGTDPDPPPEAGCAQAAADADALLLAIAQGGDEARADALLRARVDGVPVPDTLLRELIDTSPSDRVRLAAMDSWLEARAGDPRAERGALESLVVVSNAAVQHDLRRRLVELDEMERLEALAVHGVAEPP